MSRTVGTSRARDASAASSSRPRVVFSLLGTVLDGGVGPKRWTHWRPTVSLCEHAKWPISRIELIHDRRSAPLASIVAADAAHLSPVTSVRLHERSMSDPWDFQEVYAALLEFTRAYPFDTEAEDYFVHITTGTHVAQICLFLLTESRRFPAQLVQTAPVRVTKETFKWREVLPSGVVGPPPPPPDRPLVPGRYSVIDLDLSRYDLLAERFARERKSAINSLKSGIATRNPAFNRLIERLEHVALHSEDPILIEGPTGAGKSQLARRVYELRLQRRAFGRPIGQGPGNAFVELNCATLRGDAAMSALFGHRKGAFTGAAADREGLLRAADGGLLFLDEIGELGADEQAMLLRALEEKRFLPLGADREVASNFQLVCGTNRDLRAQVASGRFREDLLARINLWTFPLPSLRDRPEDIEPNLDYELEQLARRSQRLVRFNKEARDRFLAFAQGPEASWRANFRDLTAAVTRMATLAPSGRISTEVVDEEMLRLRHAWGDHPGDDADRRADERSDILASVLTPAQLDEIDPFDLVQLAEVIRTCRRCRSLSDAGRELFAASRRRKNSHNDADRLRKYLARFSLDWRNLQAPA